MIEQQLYHTVLILAAIANFSMSLVLLHGNLAYSDYTVYRNARRYIALCFAIFAFGFIIHATYQWRYTWHEAASALSVSYFHCGAVLFGWSIISLLNPNYLSAKVYLRDILFLIIGISAYWASVFIPSLYGMCEIFSAVFFFHALIIIYTFYSTYYRVSHSLQQMSLGTVQQFVKWMLLACHLIIGFGVGSIAITVLLPTAIWPYTVLLCLGIAVFVYIFFSLNDYGYVIDSATNATEDVAEK